MAQLSAGRCWYRCADNTDVDVGTVWVLVGETVADKAKRKRIKVSEEKMRRVQYRPRLGGLEVDDETT